MAQDNYVTKYDKAVRPTLLLMAEAAKLAADFGKLVIGYMVLGNAGGLAAIVVLVPIMHDTNKLWLSQQFWPAVAFGVGTAVGVATAVAAHFNYASHAWFYSMQARRDDIWIKAVEFGMEDGWFKATDAWLRQNQDSAGRRANRTNGLAVAAFVISALCWIYGAIALVLGIDGVAPQ